MKTIVAGTRGVSALSVVEAAIALSDFEITELVSGGCRGVDQLAEMWAVASNIPIKRFPADWKSYGKAAGPIRNQQMAEYGDALIAVWDGASKGTADMIRRAKAKGLRCYVLNTNRKAG